MLHFNKLYSTHQCNGKRFTYLLFDNRLPSAGQTMSLHHFKSLVQAFFLASETVLILAHIREHIFRYRYICDRPISAYQKIDRALLINIVVLFLFLPNMNHKCK